MENEIKNHWDKVFKTKEYNQVSWFQEYPNTSVEFLELFDLPLDANIVDVGAGDSRFVDVLLDKGYTNIWILDISAAALERAKTRLGEKAAKVNWIVSDVLDFEPEVQFDFWHDRAAFHFLTTEEKIAKYVALTSAAIKTNGFLVLGTFSETGPEKCSGLEIKQYTETSMSDRFNATFDRVRCIREEHATPFNTIQNFQFCSFRKK
jgi:2-polyprenyl-3-methyl-5-hydroxy-6-metoxy-1,4-benzoquinol methylase